MLAVKQKHVRMIMPWIMVVSLLVAATGMTMRLTWTDGFPALYFLSCIVLVLYIVFQLYRWEFFLFSLSTAATGFLFYSISGGTLWSLPTIALLVLDVLVLVVTFLAARAASHNKGMLVFGKTRIQLLPGKANPALIYLVDALWLLCLAAALLLDQ